MSFLDTFVNLLAADPDPAVIGPVLFEPIPVAIAKTSPRQS